MPSNGCQPPTLVTSLSCTDVEDSPVSSLASLAHALQALQVLPHQVQPVLDDISEVTRVDIVTCRLNLTAALLAWRTAAKAPSAATSAAPTAAWHVRIVFLGAGARVAVVAAGAVEIDVGGSAPPLALLSCGEWERRMMHGIEMSGWCAALGESVASGSRGAAIIACH